MLGVLGLRPRLAGAELLVAVEVWLLMAAGRPFPRGAGFANSVSFVNTCLSHNNEPIVCFRALFLVVTSFLLVVLLAELVLAGLPRFLASTVVETGVLAF